MLINSNRVGRRLSFCILCVMLCGCFFFVCIYRAAWRNLHNNSFAVFTPLWCCRDLCLSAYDVDSEFVIICVHTRPFLVIHGMHIQLFILFIISIFMVIYTIYIYIYSQYLIVWMMLGITRSTLIAIEYSHLRSSCGALMISIRNLNGRFAHIDRCKQTEWFEHSRCLGKEEEIRHMLVRTWNSKNGVMHNDDRFVKLSVSPVYWSSAFESIESSWIDMTSKQNVNERILSRSVRELVVLCASLRCDFGLWCERMVDAHFVREIPGIVSNVLRFEWVSEFQWVYENHEPLYGSI